MSWLEDGYEEFPDTASPGLPWIRAAKKAAWAYVEAATEGRRHGDTWMAGVDALANGRDGSLSDGSTFKCAARETAEAISGALPLHRGQISVVFPGYPGRDPGESDAAHRFRLKRDAAHLDGLLPVGPARRRYLREPHAWILGVRVEHAAPGASPPVVWRGSHHIMREALHAAFAGYDPADWPQIDITDAYKAARAQVFETCERVEIGRNCRSFLIHRLAIHGIAPWTAKPSPLQENDDPPLQNQPRIIVYFRPCLPDIGDWLTLP